MSIDIKRIFEEAIERKRMADAGIVDAGLLQVTRTATSFLLSYAAENGIAASKITDKETLAVFQYAGQQDTPPLIRITFSAITHGLKVDVNYYDPYQPKPAGQYEIRRDSVNSDLEKYLQGLSDTLLRHQPQ